MVSERQAQELVAQCVAHMTVYLDSGKAPSIKVETASQIRQLASLVTQWGLSHEDADEHIVQPVEAALLSLHGQEAGRILYYDFVDAYDRDAQERQLSAHPWYDYAPYRDWQPR